MARDDTARLSTLEDTKSAEGLDIDVSVEGDFEVQRF
jgi:hypothetical protein